MNLRQAGVGLGVFAGLAAGAALVRWPYNLLAEFIMDVAALLAAATVVAFVISLFYDRIQITAQRITLLFAGSLLGMYLAISAAYFGGYIGYNYPASQQRIFTQGHEITSLTKALDETKVQLASTVTQLSDAKKAMEDPHSISSPSYTLDTSLKLQFDNTGRAKAIEAHNITWDMTTVLQANQIAPATSVPAQPQPQERAAVDCSSFTNIGDPQCNRLSLNPLTSLQCPKMECPVGPRYETNNALLLVLTFPYPIRASEIKLDSYGVRLPDNKILKLTEKDAVIIFHDTPRNMVLDIEVAGSNK
jgi:hypothetical protein